MHSLLLSVGFGLVTASILALAAMGLTLQFGITNFVNFAYGDFLTLGAYGQL
jgi:branched-subunit amino acid ABC-type transport system permease component